MRILEEQGGCSVSLGKKVSYDELSLEVQDGGHLLLSMWNIHLFQPDNEFKARLDVLERPGKIL